MNYNCLTERSEEWWKRVCWIDRYLKPEPDCGAAMHIGEKCGDGYVVYAVEPEGDAGTVHVRELAFAEPQTRRDLLSFLGEKFPSYDLQFSTPVDDLFLHEIPDPRAVSVSVSPTFQFRAIDPKGAMLALSANESASGRMSFRISDPVFDREHTFGIEVQQGSISECKPRASDTLEMDVQTFAKLYSGYLIAGDAWSWGK